MEYSSYSTLINAIFYIEGFSSFFLKKKKNKNLNYELLLDTRRHMYNIKVITLSSERKRINTCTVQYSTSRVNDYFYVFLRQNEKKKVSRLVPLFNTTGRNKLIQSIRVFQ